MKFRRDLLWLLAALLFGLLVLPFLVYFTGAATLGPYSSDGPWGFYRDFWSDLVHLSGSAMTLAFGPLAITLVWRLLVFILWPSQPAEARQEPGS
jgi:hypothetical protein